MNTLKSLKLKAEKTNLDKYIENEIKKDPSLEGKLKKAGEEIEKEIKLCHKIERILNNFKNKKIGYSVAIDSILDLIQSGQEEEKKRIKSKVNRKSIEELLPKMNSAFSDLAFKVVFKEGYNTCVDEVKNLK
jgi:gamma-glutamyl:cysteine ligase YbdK (ATP-grasp superfamily)